MKTTYEVTASSSTGTVMDRTYERTLRPYVEALNRGADITVNGKTVKIYAIAYKAGDVLMVTKNCFGRFEARAIAVRTSNYSKFQLRNAAKYTAESLGALNEKAINAQYFCWLEETTSSIDKNIDAFDKGIKAAVDADRYGRDAAECAAYATMYLTGKETTGYRSVDIALGALGVFAAASNITARDKATEQAKTEFNKIRRW